MKNELEKLHKNLNGIRPMQRAPQFMIVADPNEDLIAIKEAKKRNVKVIGIIDTNTDPELVDLGIPANDDSIKSLNLIITILGDAIVYGRGGATKYAYQPDEAIVLPQEEHKTQTMTTRVKTKEGSKEPKRISTKKIDASKIKKEEGEDE